MPEPASIFEQEWWYHAATDGAWKAVEYNNGQSIKARMVFVQERRKGVRKISMPVFARVMAPALELSASKPGERLAQTVKALTGLSDTLPDHDEFSYALPPGSDLELPFCLSGHTVTSAYTYRTDPHSAHDPWREMDRKVRYNINAAGRRLVVEHHDEIERYIDLSTRFLRSKAFNPNVDRDALRRIWEACRVRQQGRILSCVDKAGRDSASAVLIWDDQHLYYWLSCRDPEPSDNAANSLLIWTAIETAQKAGLTFDVDGYATPSAGIFLSRFGLLPHRRCKVFKTNGAGRLKSEVYSHLVDMVGPKLRRRMLNLRNAVDLRSKL